MASRPIDLNAILDAPLGVCTKGLPDSLADVPLGRVGELGLSLWAGDLLTPALTLRGDRLRLNLERMMRFCREHGVALAPHGKTTMAPQLFADQLAAGAWGITAATVGQAQAMAHFGVRRILIANEVLEAAARARHVQPAGVEGFEGVVGRAVGRHPLLPRAGPRDRRRRPPRRALRRRVPDRPARLARRRAARVRDSRRDGAQRPARVRVRRPRGRAAARRPALPRHLPPCGAFDRWRTLLEVDAGYTVTRAIRTFF